MQQKLINIPKPTIPAVQDYFYDDVSWQEYQTLILTDEMNAYKGFYSTASKKIIISNFNAHRKHVELAQAKNIGNFSGLDKGWYGFSMEARLQVDELSIETLSAYYQTYMEEAVLEDFKAMIIKLFQESFTKIKFREF